MSDSKLSPGQFNLIIDNWINGTPMPVEKVKREDFEYCSHSWVLYTGLNKIEEVCCLCNKKRATENPVPSTPYSHDDNGSF